MREFVRALRAIFRAWGDGSRLDFRGEFYTHTLMTPMFSPPLPYGSPPIYLAGVGARMVEMVGEVADGFFVHPFHSRAYLRGGDAARAERAASSAAAARARTSRSRARPSCALGSNDAEIEAARRKARGQISFYGSTPAYKGVLEHHGYPALQPELNGLSKQGQWLEMMGRIDDALFDHIAVSGTPAQVGREAARPQRLRRPHHADALQRDRPRGGRGRGARARGLRPSAQPGTARRTAPRSVHPLLEEVSGMRRFILLLALAALALLGACREEGAVEKAGKKIDETIDDLTHPNEGPVEKLGRKTDEALDDAKEALEGKDD